MAQSIILNINEGVAQITLNRPQNLNSFNNAMSAAMLSALTSISADSSVRCLLITGNGRGFCAGQDLGNNQQGENAKDLDLAATLDQYYNPVIRLIHNMPIPVVCAVNGVAAGAGANLALACDLVIAAESASFIQAFCRLGLVPDAGGTWSLPRLVGMAKAKALTMLGDKVCATDAETMGMIYAVKPDAELLSHCQQLAHHLATQPTYGLSLTKRALHESLNNDLDTQLDVERDLQRLANNSEDYGIGVDAFLNKTKPHYKGR
ncbi:MAG: 2-(1,2-epoxy-1,2-dihydrophenyl)acetyl-CoA isomerase PaaG [Gammaproteobacteria bacterium]|jgi:2-(1,2-epoxy-1,2-dihydrophenyl)acetyl-CoA isomerase|nr:2-(1,2-epoxy-1,2-dihydrophenyl)acetyl-CoA isomerase PaaG [Gammaproteobacteria bacterium]